jgi:hypothetical protein
MAPHAALNAAGIEVRPWDAVLAPDAPCSDVWIEGFGCELPEHFVHWVAQETQSKQTQSPRRFG